MKRDSMGRYSSDGYGYNRGYSTHTGNFYDDMRSMLNEAPDEQTRQNIQRMLDQMGR